MQIKIFVRVDNIERLTPHGLVIDAPDAESLALQVQAKTLLNPSNKEK